jgi:L-aspartate oxidase
MLTFDSLVIGSGVAGLVYALEAARLGTVAVVTKSRLEKCNSDYAQGGIAAVLSETDSFEKHIDDTFAAGAELGRKSVIRTIVESGPEAISYLIDRGTRFTRQNTHTVRSIENLSLTREGGHSQKRVAYAADSTGHEIMIALITACRNDPNITLFESHLAIDLITQHHVSRSDTFIPGITCWGAYVLDRISGRIDVFRAKRTMLATGGAGQLYVNTTNPSVATGDGVAMAHLAGARVANLEFVQFHPTAYYSPKGETFLVSEAVRGEGAILRLPDGSTFMEKYHPMGCLAPRDVVTRAIDAEMKARDLKCLYLDATVIDPKKLRSHFRYINRKLHEHRIDFTKDWIPIVPAAHYFCGGVLTTTDGATDIRGLFAAGETACTGLHGANRLASNSLLEAIVVALRASRHPSVHEPVTFPEIPEWHDERVFNEHEWVVISHNREDIKAIMRGYVGIIRSRRLLKYAANRIQNIFTEIDNFYRHNPVRAEVIETRNMAVVAGLVIHSALLRKESRGLHYLIDFPDRDDANFLKDTVI